MKRKLWIFVIVLALCSSVKLYMVFANMAITRASSWSGRTIYLVPSTHSDTYWKGEWAGPNMGTLHDNIIDALNVIDFYPDFRFTIDQAGIASTFVTEYPEYRDRFARAIANGQIEVAGGGVSQSDLNIPDGEGILRNFLLGNAWFKREFNTSIQVAWQVDTFGATGSFPSLLAALDYKYMYYMRDSRDHPDGAFWWDGPEGSQILCWKTRYGRYPITAPDLVAMIYGTLQESIATSLPSGSMMLHIGGDKAAPLAALMDYVENWNVFYSQQSQCRVKVATPSEFFRAIAPETAGLPHYGFGQDLNPYNEGALISYLETKVASRLWETSATTAEIFSTLGRNFMNLSSIVTPGELEAGWWLNTFLYHHDAVTGTCPATIMQNILADYREQLSRARDVENHALGSFAREVNVQSSDPALVVFNSESMLRTGIVETTIPVDLAAFPGHGTPAFNQSKIGITMNDTRTNASTPVQVLSMEPLSDDLVEMKIAFAATVESVGFHAYTYRLNYNATPGSYGSIMGWQNSSNQVNIWNGVYNITWNMDNGGNINSLLYNGVQQIDAGQSIGLWYTDTSNEPYDVPIGDVLDQTADVPATYSFYPGQLLSRLVIQVELPWYRLDVEYRIRVNSTLIDVTVNYHHLPENGSIANLLMMNWPCTNTSASWTCGEPYGWTDHTSDAGSDRPFPATYWSCVESSTCGLGIYDRGSLGRDWNVGNQRMSLVLVHQNDPVNPPPGFSNPRAHWEKADFQYDEIEEYSLDLAFEYYTPGWASAQVPQHGRGFNHPLYTIGVDSRAFPQFPHFVTPQPQPRLPGWGSFFSSNASNVVLTAFKPAEQQNGLVFRLFSYPAAAAAGAINITWLENLNPPAPPSQVHLVSALEKNFTADPADPSLDGLPTTYAMGSIEQGLILPAATITERSLRTFLIPVTTMDVLAPLISWTGPIYGIVGFPLQITLTVEDRSPVNVTGIYSADGGEHWHDLPAFTVEDVGPGRHAATSVVVPGSHGKMWFQLNITDAAGNRRMVGDFHTSFVHYGTTYGDQPHVSYHSPQVRILWPVYLIGPFVGAMIVLIWLFFRKRN
nr:hypothetical protein [Candidatus Sigynarchaeota archaeon]